MSKLTAARMVPLGSPKKARARARRVRQPKDSKTLGKVEIEQRTMRSTANLSSARPAKQMTRKKDRRARLQGFADFAHWARVQIARAAKGLAS